MIEIRNAMVTKVSLTTADRGVLDAWLFLDYGGMTQDFGGYSLYLPKSFSNHVGQCNYAGLFIVRCMEICGVSEWSDIPGKSIRVKSSYHSVVEAIGHIIKDDWFDPSSEFKILELDYGKAT